MDALVIFAILFFGVLVGYSICYLIHCNDYDKGYRKGLKSKEAEQLLMYTDWD